MEQRQVHQRQLLAQEVGAEEEVQLAGLENLRQAARIAEKRERVAAAQLGEHAGGALDVVGVRRALDEQVHVEAQLLGSPCAASGSPGR